MRLISIFLIISCITFSCYCQRADDFLDFVRAGDIDRVRVMIDDDRSLLNAAKTGSWKTGFTGLMLAIEKGNEKMVDVLLQSGADVHAISKNGQYPLMLAVRHSFPRVVEMLLNKGADPNGAVGPSHVHYHETPLIAAVRLSHRINVRALVSRGADPDLRDTEGRSAVDWARQTGDGGNMLKIVFGEKAKKVVALTLLVVVCGVYFLGRSFGLMKALFVMQLAALVLYANRPQLLDSISLAFEVLFPISPLLRTPSSHRNGTNSTNLWSILVPKGMRQETFAYGLASIFIGVCGPMLWPYLTAKLPFAVVAWASVDTLLKGVCNLNDCAANPILSAFGLSDPRMIFAYQILASQIAFFNAPLSNSLAELCFNLPCLAVTGLYLGWSVYVSFSHAVFVIPVSVVAVICPLLALWLVGVSMGGYKKEAGGLASAIWASAFATEAFRSQASYRALEILNFGQAASLLKSALARNLSWDQILQLLRVGPTSVTLKYQATVFLAALTFFVTSHKVVEKLDEVLARRRSGGADLRSPGRIGVLAARRLGRGVHPHSD